VIGFRENALKLKEGLRCGKCNAADFNKLLSTRFDDEVHLVVLRI